MIPIEDFRRFALSLPEAGEAKHFDLASFQVKKKIFATLNAPEGRATIRLSPEDQYAFCAVSQGAMYPVPNRWGHYGWTHIDLEKGDWEMCRDALQAAWWGVAPKTLQKKYPELNVVGEE